MASSFKSKELHVIQTLNASREKFLAFLKNRISDSEVAEDLLQHSLLQALKYGG